MRILFVSLFLTSFLVPLAHAAVSVKCPDQVEKLSFKNLRLFDGDPKKNEDLQPYSEGKTSHRWIMKGTEPWYTCEYGPKAKKLVAKKITEDIALCKTVESVKGSGKFDSLKCD